MTLAEHATEAERQSLDWLLRWTLEKREGDALCKVLSLGVDWRNMGYQGQSPGYCLAQACRMRHGAAINMLLDLGSPVYDETLRPSLLICDYFTSRNPFQRDVFTRLLEASRSYLPSQHHSLLGMATCLPMQQQTWAITQMLKAGETIRSGDWGVIFEALRRASASTCRNLIAQIVHLPTPIAPIPDVDLRNPEYAALASEILAGQLRQNCPDASRQRRRRL